MNKISWVIIFFVLLNLSLPANSLSSVDKLHLEQAKESIKSHKYHKGYLEFKQMAKQGCPFSQCLVGIMNKQGLGTKKNINAAVYWFKKSAQQGFADAEWRLGSMYYKGEDVTKDLPAAKQWLNLALAHGVGESQQLLSNIEAHMPAGTPASGMPQNSAWTVQMIQQAWQGYDDVVKQLEKLASGPVR